MFMKSIRNDNISVVDYASSVSLSIPNPTERVLKENFDQSSKDQEIRF